jgi:hypothetical protein
MKFSLIKWRLMLTTLPVAAGIVLLKYLIITYLDYQGHVNFTDIDPIITCSVFLISFMFFGTVWDYKESEKIPSELACIIESIEDKLTLAHQYKGGFDLHQGRTVLAEIAESVLKWFRKQETDEGVYNKISGITGLSLTLEKAGVQDIALRVNGEQQRLRTLFSRMAVIKKTGFLPSGYAFLELMTAVIMILLLMSRFDNLIFGLLVVGFVTQIFVYMMRLIRDIDQPFEYSSRGSARAADVELFPLRDYAERLRNRLL